MYRAVSFALLLSGCGAVANHQTMAVTTSPAGATCEMRREQTVIGAIAATPGAIELRRSLSEVSIVCWKDGYGAAAYTAYAEPEYAMLFDGPQDQIIDLVTGTASRYERNVHLVLPRLNQVSSN